MTEFFFCWHWRLAKKILCYIPVTVAAGLQKRHSEQYTCLCSFGNLKMSFSSGMLSLWGHVWYWCVHASCHCRHLEATGQTNSLKHMKGRHNIVQMLYASAFPHFHCCAMSSCRWLVAVREAGTGRCCNLQILHQVRRIRSSKQTE